MASVAVSSAADAEPLAGRKELLTRTTFGTPSTVVGCPDSGAGEVFKETTSVTCPSSPAGTSPRIENTPHRVRICFPFHDEKILAPKRVNNSRAWTEWNKYTSTGTGSNRRR